MTLSKCIDNAIPNSENQYLNNVVGLYTVHYISWIKFLAPAHFRHEEDVSHTLLKSHFKN